MTEVTDPKLEPHASLVSVAEGSPASRACAHGRGTYLQAGDIIASCNGHALLGHGVDLSQINSCLDAEWAKGELTVTVLRKKAVTEEGAAVASGALTVPDEVTAAEA